ncbi:serine/threonine protein kinase [Streptomyces ipomoeae]|uniref:non-specific serine/threonine protein kinase n=2 Tax=Streptomyces ipomoeae TaxID=103232 RepID=L1KM15_9ACTN|nr:protein kinase [Streptomyces ipomoeae]EKX61530.1 kinase domain protein [Streptomyces ipomoeae 91-03]MDX2692546.1 protein kinase [Streptomyces ipomoeae]MDX2820118.1 protein kinase [Streptomyces ipomoeae]MDX2838198.1 protein kinase [Streptomyces ipomoeae]MDX2872768.1 protein kinase [Streptomyces ipomoeae]
MAQQQRSQGPSDPEATGGGMSDAPESWGNGGLVGDGRYRLTHRLGRGGMAEVFAAEDVRLGRTVAVKLLRSDLAEDPISKARFTREAQSVAGLNHHAIVAVYDSGEDVVGGTSVPYIVMELVEGRTIRDLLLNAEAPGPEQALIIVSGVLEALAYSHQHGIVHRDIKPANVIITTNGAVKVMDFGIARALHGASTTMTQTGMVMGTPQYLSPEQALGKAVDHRSDLYATGCLLYELLALRPPFVGETPLSVVYQHVQDIPVPPSEVSEGTAPPELDGLVMRSLAKEPDDRFQTAEEMRGLVQYGLQMLYDQGGHTGTWNTGPVTVHDGRHTPPGGMAGTTVMPHPGEAGTSQIAQPIIPGYGGGRDDGGFEGHGNRGSGRGKLWILAVLAVVAVAVGVAVALRDTGGSGGTPETTKSPTASTSSKDEKASETPSDEPTEETTDDSTGSGNGSNYTPSYTPSPTYSPSAPETQPTEEPTDTEPTTEEPTPTEPTDDSTPTADPTADGSGSGSGGLTSGVTGGDDEE